MHRFFRLILRTTDTEAAGRFYGQVLGDGAALLDIVKLHEQALARGARPHWLGFIEVADVDAASAAFVGRGATPLAPKWVNPRGLEAAVMRDPGGAIVACARQTTESADTCPAIALHVLNTAGLASAMATYSELFGWDVRAAVEVPGHGTAHPFAWAPGEPVVGSMSAVEDRPAVHPHWLFFFPVADLQASIAAVRNAGGRVVDPSTLPDGSAIAVCEDSEGAAFGLCQGQPTLGA